MTNLTGGKMRQKFNPQKFIEQKIAEIKKIAGDKKTLCALSGGVDSFTCALLGKKALGENLSVYFLDDGLMREGEGKYVVKIGKRIGVEIKIENVAGEFFKNLKGLTDPEEKRKAFRETFYQTLKRLIIREGAKFLIQGTIKADVLETKKGIKTQHNVLTQIGIDTRKYRFALIEPLRDLFKPEVRLVAKSLGLPKEIYQRQPFPGPGLCARVVGEVTPERVEIARKAGKIIEEELKRFKPFQCFAVLLADEATGIVNGQRKLGQIVVIRSVDSKDALTARVTKIPFSFLEKIQKRIITSLPSVVKVLFDITPKPPSTIEYV